VTLGVPSLIHIGRSLLRYWGVSLLNILCLAIGFAAAVTIALYVKDELSFDRFIPQSDRVYLLTSVYGPTVSPQARNDAVPAGMADWLRRDSPAIDTAARVNAVDWSVTSPRFEALEHFYWADSNLFDLLRLKAVAGNLKNALSLPNSLVLTQKMARRYFGREDVIGRTLILNGSMPVTITAVLADFPANTNLNREIFVSGQAYYAMLHLLDTHPDWQWASCYTYVRLKPGANISEDQIERIAAQHWRNPYNLPVRFALVPLGDLHFQPEADNQMAPRGHKDTVIAMEAVAGLILFLAAINFAGLMTAQIDERSSEMAVRRSLGAQRRDLFLQVICEAGVVNLLAVVAGLALVERLLAPVNSILGLELSLWRSPGFVVCLVLGAMAVGILGGLYPAVILSAATPNYTPREHGGANTSYLTRIGWIAVQFSLMIALLISSQTVYQQWSYATGAALNFNADRLLMIDVFEKGGLEPSFKRHLIAVPGVEGAAYSRSLPEEKDVRPGWLTSPTGVLVQFTRESVDEDFFRLYRVKLLAGRSFSSAYPENLFPHDVIVSRSAAKAFGYHQPEDAIGRVLDYRGDHARIRSTIIGVVDDMRIATVREPLRPIVFDSQAFFFNRLSVKLKPGDQSGTLAAIDRVWRKDYPNNGPIDSHLYSDYLAGVYRDMIQQWWAFGLLSVVGGGLSILGLSGLSIYLARTRLRELAIRNALGARQWDIFLLRIEPFIKPLIIANIAGGLLSAVLMSWWLNSFAAHVDLDPMTFVSSGVFTVLIALVTLTAHALTTSPAHSSHPLRTD